MSTRRTQISPESLLSSRSLQKLSKPGLFRWLVAVGIAFQRHFPNFSFLDLTKKFDLITQSFQRCEKARSTVT